MSRKTAGRVHHQRECIYCKGGIAEQRPVFLVADSTGAILGPFHAGCAQRLKLEQEKMHAERGMPNAQRFGTWPSRREEGSPW